MAKIIRYNGNLVPFASASLGTERTIFGEVTQADDITSQFTPDFLRGWGIVGPSDQPSLQDFNAVSFTHGQILAYLHQMGVPEYNAAQEFHLNSVTTSGGAIYISLVNTNVGSSPASSPAQWRNVSTGALIGVQKFTASGTYTPTAGMKTVIVEAQAAGGGSGGAPATGAGGFSGSPGGSSGSYAKVRLTDSQVGASVAVTIGNGGIAGPVGAGSGGVGGTTSFGALVSCAGGPGSTSYGPISSVVFMVNGPAVAADPLISAGLEITAVNGNPGSPGIGSTAGGIILAIGAAAPISGASNDFGCGARGTGLGASSASIAGVAGGKGIIIIWEYA